MTRTIVTPQQGNVHLPIPPCYIGRRIEVSFFALDELEAEEGLPQSTLGDFSGILSEKDYLQLKDHTAKARKEWNRDF